MSLYLGVGNQGQFPDVLHILVVSSLGRGKVEATGGELVGVVKNDLVVIEDLQQASDEPPIRVVCHTAPIVTLTGQVTKGLQGRLLVVVDEHLKGNKFIRSTCRSFIFFIVLFFYLK